MARFIKGINGAYTGKVGNVVGSSWRGIDYVRSLPKKSGKPASDDQLAQRAKFAMTTNFLKSIKEILLVGYSDAKLRSKTGYNAAFSHFISQAIKGDYPNYEVDYSVVQIARGGLAPLLGLQVEETAPQVLTLSWVEALNRFNAFADDEVIVLVYSPQDHLFSIYEGATRGGASVEVSMPSVYSGRTIVGWAFVINRDGSSTSNSQFLGEITLS